MTRTYITNELGDVHQVDEDGVLLPVEPNDWGWITVGGKKDFAECRTPIDTLRGLPGFVVQEEAITRLTPGPRTRRSTWDNFVDGEAPPAAVLSKGGTGTLGYFDRLSEAVGNVSIRLPAKPDRSPMLIFDFVGGRKFTICYQPPAPSLVGLGTVYVLEDGFGVKVGYTSGPVAKRIGELQTGNPRRIAVLAEIGNATYELEELLHSKLNEWNIGGEWFARGPLVSHATAAGGFGNWLTTLIGDDSVSVVIHPPYR